MKNILSKILRYLPNNKRVRNKNIKSLLITLGIYIGIGFGLTVVKVMLGKIPLVGNLFYNIGSVYKLYSWVGAIIAAIQCFGNDDYSEVEYVTFEDIKNLKSLWESRNVKIAMIVCLSALCIIPNGDRPRVARNSDKENIVASSDTNEIKEVEKVEEQETLSVEESIVEELSTIPEVEEEIVEEVSTVETEETTTEEVADEMYNYLGVSIDGKFFHIQENKYTEIKEHLVSSDSGWFFEDISYKIPEFTRDIPNEETKKEKIKISRDDDKETIVELWLSNPQNIELYGGFTENSTRDEIIAVWGEPDYFGTEYDQRIYDYYVSEDGLYFIEILYTDNSQTGIYGDDTMTWIKFRYYRKNFLSMTKFYLLEGSENEFGGSITF